MHSRIYQLSKTPIFEDDMIEASDYWEDNFIGSIADYVAESNDREDDIEWLISSLEKHGVTYDAKKETITFPKDFKKRYFEARLNELKNEVAKITIDDFVKSFPVYKIKMLIEDKFGFQIVTKEYGTLSLDRFVRELEDEALTFYIGSTLDYHF